MAARGDLRLVPAARSRSSPHELGCEADEEAVFDVPPLAPAGGVRGVAAARDRHRRLLLDDGFPAPGDGFGWQVMGELAGCRVRPVCGSRRASRPEIDVATARAHGFAALKTIAAYRGGLRLDGGHPLWRVLEANEATGDPLPVQVHCGFGDSDLLLPLADPGLAEAR